MLENNLRKVRQRRGYSQTNLTQKTGISSSIISAIENRKLYPHPGWRKRLATALETTENKLFPGVVKHDTDSKDKITSP
ncbi:MAG: helix-turn-helix transcriptional regulator [Firmicutes bacterium]|nr:helix-turn-helix transcriptional regulator [Bacillota bacterium]